MKTLLHCFKQLLHLLRESSGEAAYDRYVLHWQQHHAGEGEPLSRKAFYRQEVERKWSGVKRCC